MPLVESLFSLPGQRGREKAGERKSCLACHNPLFFLLLLLFIHSSSYIEQKQVTCNEGFSSIEQ
jgi:hypothetical protein